MYPEAIAWWVPTGEGLQAAASASASGCLCWFARNSNSKRSPKASAVILPATNVTLNLRIKPILTKNVFRPLCGQVWILLQCSVCFLWNQWISNILLAAVSCVTTFIYFLLSVCFLYFSCLYLFFLWALEPQRRSNSNMGILGKTSQNV